MVLRSPPTSGRTLGPVDSSLCFALLTHLRVVAMVLASPVSGRLCALCECASCRVAADVNVLGSDICPKLLHMCLGYMSRFPQFCAAFYAINNHLSKRVIATSHICKLASCCYVLPVILGAARFGRFGLKDADTERLRQNRSFANFPNRSPRDSSSPLHCCLH